MDNLSTLNGAITLGVALLGAVLGIINTWQSISTTRFRLRVKPAYAIAMPSGETMFSIEVVNLSNFPVTIREVGFTLEGNTLRKPRAAVVSPILLDGGSWPRRLGPREAVSVYMNPSQFVESSPKIGKAYAQTVCGEAAYGTSDALTQLKQLLA